MSPVGLVKKLTLSVAVIVVLVLPTVASANLPKKPACADVPTSLVVHYFFTLGGGPSTGKSNPTPLPAKTESSSKGELGCLYQYTYEAINASHVNQVATSGVYIEYHWPVTRKQWLADPDFSGGARVSGIGDAATLIGKGSILGFHDGIYSVTIKNGTGMCEAPSQGGNPAMCPTVIEAFAKAIIPLI